MTAALKASGLTVTPETVDAGATMTLTAKLASTPPRDMTGQTLQIIDHDDAPAGELEIVQFDGRVNRTGKLTLDVPSEPGTYEWRAVPLAGAKQDDLQETEALAFTVTVTAHTTRLNVWGVPTAIEAGSRFTAEIGLKCSSGCEMTGRRFEVVDATGEVMGNGTLSGEILPGTQSLYVARAELTAPETEGRHDWSIRVDAGDALHPGAEAPLRIRTTAAAEALVTVRVTDSESGDPLPGQSVVMHPYRATTDEDGCARLRVAKGSYTVFVSGRGRYPMRRKLDVEDDVTTEAALQAEPPPSGNW
ncbi:peptidase associated/transthyretin-like domain-containing protein [Histidinibacterium aquaticum]|uniref:Carboxypeptidase-like regulatory domain-containing protein n=1 Tax=Histidinibacterium aquaticum TaxID=2613962 RepID=A0A5J5GQA8_9RHOB|nr:carboxypeptidase regulatory-like domain-containing protein [Histidinibacterium aquaticum]KAA9009943.1 carboxypeptidase-like regulatory domain-containing protein [Histidinibacterium aquaticum]